MTACTTLDKAMTEQQLLEAITEAATLYGWMWFHIRRSDKAQQMGNSGFPDLVLAREGEPVWFLELKSEKGRPSADQLTWLAVLIGMGRHAFVVRPSDLDSVLRGLAR